MTTPANNPFNSRRPRLILAGVILAFSIYLLAFLLPDIIRNLGGPESMTMASAAEIASEESSYVALNDGAWECDTLEHIIGYSSSTERFDVQTTEIFLTDPSGKNVVLADLSGEVECDELQGSIAEGYLVKMSADVQQELTNEVRLARFINGENYMELCGYCGTTNSGIGAAFGILFFLLGIACLIWGLRTPAAKEPQELS